MSDKNRGVVYLEPGRVKVHDIEIAGADDEAARKGALSLSLGTGWAKSLSFTTGQCPGMRYHRGLMTDMDPNGLIAA